MVSTSVLEADLSMDTRQVASLDEHPGTANPLWNPSNAFGSSAM